MHLYRYDQQKIIVLNLQDWRQFSHYKSYTCGIIAVSINLYESGKGLTPILEHLLNNKREGSRNIIAKKRIFNCDQAMLRFVHMITHLEDVE
jgi:hypothetical protein